MCKKTRKVGPLKMGQLLIHMTCPACHGRFRIGDFYTLIPLGPGKYEEKRELAKEGKHYTPQCTRIHWDCSFAAYE